MTHLSRADLIALTSSGGVLAQIRWLVSHGVPFRYADRRVWVLRAVAQDWELMGALQNAEARLDLVR